MEINEKEIKVNDISKQSMNFAYAFGGYAIGKAVGKVVDKFVSQQVVSGLGVPESMGTKIIKPVILLAGASVLSISSKDKMVKTIATGVGIAGAEDAVKIVTGKETLFGLGEYDEDYSSVNSQVLPQLDLQLPELSGDMQEEQPYEYDEDNDDYENYDTLEDDYVEEYA